MKSRSEIWLSALEDLGAECSVDTTRDAVTLTRRIEHEGESFFTVTLPAYARDLERSLAIGQIAGELFIGWSRTQLNVNVVEEYGGRKVKKYSHRGIPQFLGGFMNIVFDSDPDMSREVYLRNCLRFPDFGALMRVHLEDELETAKMASAILAIRQLCLMFSKEQELCSDELIEASIQRYVAHDGTLVDPFLTSGRSSFLSLVTCDPSEG
jgi:hypothetical protein